MSQPCHFPFHDIDKIAAAFHDGFTDGNGDWNATPEHHKDKFREGARAALSAALSGMAEPVAWQRRIRAGYRDHTDCASPWEECDSVEAKDMFERQPSYEYRPLFATPPASDRAEIERLRKALEGAVWTASVFHRPFASRRGKDRMPTIHSIKGTFATEQEAIAKANEVIAHGRPSIETFIDRETAEPLATFHLTKEGLEELGRIHSELSAALNPEGK